VDRTSVGVAGDKRFYGFRCNSTSCAAHTDNRSIDVVADGNVNRERLSVPPGVPRLEFVIFDTSPMTKSSAIGHPPSQKTPGNKGRDDETT
jgi:hypothetical protein